VYSGARKLYVIEAILKVKEAIYAEACERIHENEWK
jgi:hypothetical protein